MLIPFFDCPLVITTSLIIYVNSKSTTHHGNCSYEVCVQFKKLVSMFSSTAVAADHGNFRTELCKGSFP